MDRRDRSFQMWNTDAYGWEESTDPLYKHIPFFLSLRKDGSSYGLFLDNTFRTSFDFTTELPDALSFGAQDGYLIYRDHSEKGTADQEPWVHSPEREAIRKRYIELRYQLMPYLYTIAAEASRSGVLMIRPLFLEFPKKEDRDFYLKLLDSEFFLGPALLVAPQMSEILDAYGVSFPTGVWHDYWTSQRLIDTSHVTIQPKLDVLPVFVRAGSIILSSKSSKVPLKLPPNLSSSRLSRHELPRFRLSR